MSHGLKSLAKELPKHGRFGDSIVAHINPQEAAMLKAMGGSGTINPVTGLPEYWGGLGGIVKGITNAVSSVVKPVYNTTLKNIPGVDQALVGLDKSVGKAIPGGWGTVGTVAASMIPGMQPLAMAGLGALSGSGVLRKDGKFNLQGALMGGAAAYGMANLASGLQSAAGSSIPAGDIAAANLSADPIGALNASQSWTGPAAEAATKAAAQTAGTAATNFAYTPSGEMVPSNISPDITGAIPTAAAVPAPSGLENLAQGYGQNVAATGKGLTNLTGMGAEGFSGISPAASAFGSTGATLQNTAVPIAMGGMGLADLDAQAQYLKDQQTSGTITNEEYNTQMAEIDAARGKANEAMSANPYSFGTNTATNAADAIKQNPYMFAAGGSVMDGEAGADSYYMGDSDDNYAMGGIPGYALGGMAGGRFLSGGGDGVSDDIPAVIGDSQPAKLADGEFVIPARVVSELGNGSSKAGAKQLYAMMDRVQKARGTTVGKGKFAKDSNSEKYLPA